MTEEEWLTATDPEPMLLDVLCNRASDRKFRLFAVGCCRRMGPLLVDPRSQKGVDVAERFADQLATEQEREAAYTDARRVVTRAPAVEEAARFYGPGTAAYHANGAAACVAMWIAQAATTRPAGAVSDREWWVAQSQERLLQTKLLREIFGNPLRPVAFDRAWQTPTVNSVAQAIYDERQLPSGLFDNQRMGVLADALEEAGCDNPDILGHLRGVGDHVRGCWAVDLVLGKQ
jgi:hypothetical protein